MVPLCKYTKPIFVRSLRHTNSILTRNLAMPRRTIPNNPIEWAVREKLNANLNPMYLRVINESFMHDVPTGSETHFKIIVVSDKFQDVPLLQRHRMVNEILDDELKKGVHALSLIARTPHEWSSNAKVQPSPKCENSKK